MKNRKFGDYTISDQAPKAGDKMICVQKKNFNFGKIETATSFQVEHNVIDTVNWKVIVNDGSVKVDDLLKFKEEQEVVYASHFGANINKKLVLTLSGGYKVYNNNEVVLETMTPAYAAKTYNTI